MISSDIQHICENARSFSMGSIYITPTALACLSNEDVKHALSRHARCDWGDLESEDSHANDLALQNGGRLFSAYHSTQGTKFWVITEWDRSTTTILLPEDY